MKQDKEKTVNKQGKPVYYSPPIVLGTVQAGDILASSHPKDKQIKIKLYDFKRPDKFSREQIKTLSVLHEYFTRLATNSMSAQLRYVCEFSVELLDQMTFGEYIKEIPNPTTLAVINMHPLKGSTIIQIDNTVTFPIIERVTGRTEVKQTGYARDLTDIEQSLMEGIFVRLLANFREAWSTVIDLKPRLGQIETNPQFAQIVPPTEMVIVIVLKCTIHTVEGRISICLPYLTIEPVIEKLSARYWYSCIGKKEPETNYPVSHFKADSIVFYETEKISLKRLHTLSYGSLIKIPDLKKGEAYLSCGSESILRLKPEKVKGSGSWFKIKDSGKNEVPEELISGPITKTLKTTEIRIADTVSEILLPFEEKMLKGYTIIEKRLKELADRQNELSDQIYFNSKEKILQENGTDKNLRPFQFLDSFETDHIITFIRHEHPQVIALILAYCEPVQSSELLCLYPGEMQIDIAERIATLDRVHPDVIHEIERILKIKLAHTDTIITAGGIDSVVDILSLSPRGVEKTILDGLEKTDSKLAGAIKKKIFLFEYILLLDPRAVKLVLEKTDINDLVFALKGSKPDVKEHILNCMDNTFKEAVKKRLQGTGPVRVQEVEAAQQGIIDTIRKLEKEGTIFIAGSSGELVE